MNLPAGGHLGSQACGPREKEIFWEEQCDGRNTGLGREMRGSLFPGHVELGWEEVCSATA